MFKTGRVGAVLFLLLFLMPLAGLAQEGPILFREGFANLENWRPLYFPKIKRHTLYTVESGANGRYLKAESNASASALVFKKTFNVYDYPRIRWQWLVNNVYQKGDVRTKAGDDYPLRVYILFQYNPEQAEGFDQVKYALAKTLYGEYPPHSTLNYIWANKAVEKGVIVANPFVKQAMMIALQAGTGNTGRWQEEQVHILEDYQKAFGKKPPSIATIGIMNDSDNTGEHSVSYVRFIEVFR